MGKIHLNRARQNLGQFTAEEIADGLASGRFAPTDLAWREGMESWQPISTFTDLPVVPPPADVPAVAHAAPVPPAGEPHVSTIPWDRRGEIGFFTAFWETIAQTLGKPTAIFSGLPDAPPLPGPYRFYLVLAFICGGINVLITTAFVKFVIGWISSTPELASDPQGASLIKMLERFNVGEMLLALALMAPLMPFVSAGIFHGLLALMGGAKHSFAKTFAVTCYVLGSVSPFQLLLCVGPLVQGVWAMVSLIFGLAAAHRTETWRTAVVIAISILISCGFYTFLVIISASSPA